MTQIKPHGIIEHTHITRKNDYLYRVSLKGVIRNDAGEVLVVREKGTSWWDLPGGGMDHDEKLEVAIAREMKEEVELTGDFAYKVIAVDGPDYLDIANVWQIRLIFEIRPEVMDFAPGEDGEEVQFIDPLTFKTSRKSIERRIYEYSVLT
jgi:8-oxo-dGTP pyrophosphatase MutT (NUDIX family)